MLISAFQWLKSAHKHSASTDKRGTLLIVLVVLISAYEQGPNFLMMCVDPMKCTDTFMDCVECAREGIEDGVVFA